MNGFWIFPEQHKIRFTTYKIEKMKYKKSVLVPVFTGEQKISRQMCPILCPFQPPTTTKMLVHYNNNGAKMFVSFKKKVGAKMSMTTKTAAAETKPKEKKTHTPERRNYRFIIFFVARSLFTNLLLYNTPIPFSNRNSYIII